MKPRLLLTLLLAVLPAVLAAAIAPAAQANLPGGQSGKTTNHYVLSWSATGKNAFTVVVHGHIAMVCNATGRKEDGEASAQFAAKLTGGGTEHRNFAAACGHTKNFANYTFRGPAAEVKSLTLTVFYSLFKLQKQELVESKPKVYHWTNPRA